jgi:hypothetical protein
MSYAESGGYESFTPAEVGLLYQAVRDYIVRGSIGNRSLPAAYGPLHVRLASSVRGTKTCAPQPQSSPLPVGELIDTTEAAAILNCSERWVRDPRFREKLSGREIGGRWLFPRKIVVEYAARKAGQNK